MLVFVAKTLYAKTGMNCNSRNGTWGTANLFIVAYIHPHNFIQSKRAVYV